MENFIIKLKYCWGGSKFLRIDGEVYRDTYNRVIATKFSSEDKAHAAGSCIWKNCNVVDYEVVRLS